MVISNQLIHQALARTDTLDHGEIAGESSGEISCIYHDGILSDVVLPSG